MDCSYLLPLKCSFIKVLLQFCNSHRESCLLHRSKTVQKVYFTSKWLQSLYALRGKELGKLSLVEIWRQSDILRILATDQWNIATTIVPGRVKGLTAKNNKSDSYYLVIGRRLTDWFRVDSKWFDTQSDWFMVFTILNTRIRYKPLVQSYGFKSSNSRWLILTNWPTVVDST